MDCYFSEDAAVDTARSTLGLSDGTTQPTTNLQQLFSSEPVDFKKACGAKVNALLSQHVFDFKWEVCLDLYFVVGVPFVGKAQTTDHTVQT